MNVESTKGSVLSDGESKPKREQFSQQEPLGRGTRKTVYGYPDQNGDKVIGFFHDYIIQPSERTLRTQFYLTKIVHLLLPEEIPGMYDYDAKPAYFIRERIDFTPIYLAGMKDEAEYNALIGKLEDIGVEVDKTALNFVRSRSGTVVYLEELGSYSKKELFHAIKKTLTGDKQEEALEYAACLK